MNDVEFVNAYITRLKATIDDLMNKNLILETRLALAEPKIEQLMAQREKLIEQAAKTVKKEKKIEDNTF